MSEKIWLSFDVGSVSLKTVILSSSGEVVFEDYRRSNGRPYQSALQILTELKERFETQEVRAVAVTGSGAGTLAEIIGGQFVNEIIAQSVGLAHLAPEVRTAIEMGGQDSKLLMFECEATSAGAQSNSAPILKDFSMNSLCAAGTGSFLDQQATRLGVAIEREFGELALKSTNPPRIAGRCSVFAKSDMIHLQQIATPVHDIAAGLCLALARSFISTVGKGKTFERPVAFLGGVASNSGMVRAFEKVLSLESGQLIVPAHHRTSGAIGAALHLIEKNEETPFYGIKALEKFLSNQHTTERKSLTPLCAQQSAELSAKNQALQEINSEEDERTKAYLGIDVGSISTNVVALDENDRVLAKRYLRTASRPIEAVQRGLAEIAEEIGDRIEVLGVGTTGSGRYLTGELVGADVIRNEITAQATAAILIDPTVDTIFEIGGQDSKYISIDHGTVCDFEMNKACAAGTGSFLEEQAERLRVDLKQEFSSMALGAKAPVGLGDRCTVFMESDLVHHQQHGASTPDLLAGLAYSIVHNYLNRVVGDRRVGERIFFQGGTAFNKSVVAAFRVVTGTDIIVPPHHEVTGAIGVAMLARQNAEKRLSAQEEIPYTTRFRGFDFSSMDYEIKSFVCKSCENLCEIRRVQLEDNKPVFYGSRCEKFDVDQHANDTKEIPDLFAERDALLLGDLDPFATTPAQKKNKGTVGIPLALSFYEFLPFWRTFFQSLGFDVRLSGRTTKTVARRGVENTSYETCYPVKIAHGHLLELTDQEIDFIFLPSQIDAKTEDFGKNDATAFNCPFIQALPYTSQTSIDFTARGAKVFSPVLQMQLGIGCVEKEINKHRKQLHSSKREIHTALKKAEAVQDNFQKTLEQRGKEILAEISEERPGLVVVSRPYNGCDLGLNLDLPKKLRSLGITPIPLDMLPLSEIPLQEKWRKVYWRYGQRILKSADIIKANPNLFAVYVTNFSCGPDSFILEFFRKEMNGKPYLQLEIDEHSADAGLVTRCEAFLDTLGNLEKDGDRRVTPSVPWVARNFTNHRRLYVPNMSPHSHALAAAFRSQGTDAVVMDASDEETLELGRRHTSGRECYPCLLTTGDMIRQTQRPDFDREKSAFFMGSADGPCRFGQYNHLQRNVLDKLGYDDVPILALEQDNEYRQGLDNLGPDLERNAFQGIAAIDVLEKLLHETRPYETHAGETEKWFWDSVQEISSSLEKGRKEFWKVLPRVAKQHKKIERGPKDGRPLIGILGEVYVRTNAYANNSIIRSIEALGAEATVPTMSEWFLYINHLRVGQNKAKGRYADMLKDIAAQKVLHHDEKKVYAQFDKSVDVGCEKLFDYAKPYLDASFQGEAILTIGKAVELLTDHGVSGIINTMPFTCLPGTICSALLKSVREDHKDVPVFNIAFTGQSELNNEVRLEAFLYQSQQYHEEHVLSHA